MSSSIAEAAFSKFDWSNEGWQNYFDNIFPTPPVTRVQHFKRKWFKLNINEHLEITPPTESSNTDKPSSYNTSSPIRSNNKKKETVTSLTSLGFLLCGCIFSILYALPILGLTNCLKGATLCYIAGFLLDIISRLGLNMEYWQSALVDETGQTLFITVAALCVKSWMGLASPFLTSVMIFADKSYIWTSKLPSSIANNNSLLSGVAYINSSRYQIMQLKANTEVMVGFTTILSLFMGSSSIMAIILYWNAIRFKYQANAFTQSTFRKINGILLGWFSHPMCPSLLKVAYNFIGQQLRNFVPTQAR